MRKNIYHRSNIYRGMDTLCGVRSRWRGHQSAELIQQTVACVVCVSMALSHKYMLSCARNLREWLIKDAFPLFIRVEAL